VLALIARITLVTALAAWMPKLNLTWVLDHMDIGVAGYFVLFSLLFLCGMGLPVPEDIPLLVAGALIGRGKMHVVVAAALAWCGIIGGDCMLYMFGKRFGLGITRVPLIGKHVTQERILRAEALFEKWGVWVVAVGRLFAGIRGAMVIAAGTIRYNFIKFIIADGLAALVSGGLFLFLGYEFGNHLHEIQEKIHKDSRIVFAVVATAVVALVAYVVFRKKKHTTMTDATLAKAEQRAMKHPRDQAPKAAQEPTG
jgi:membrane protein DedA with SNARE-associated domain